MLRLQRSTAALSSAESTNPHPLCNSVTRRPQKCVRVPNVCFEAEQILLHGKTAPGALRRLNAVLNKTRDPSDAFSRLHPTYRPTASVARPGEPFDFLPLAVGVKRASGRKRTRYLFRHATGPTPEAFSPVPAVAFYTTWSNSFTELFSRAVVQLFELWCRTAAGRDVHLIPAMWGSLWGPDYARFWLHPFTAHPVEPMALTPPKSDVKLLWRAQANDAKFLSYRNHSEAIFGARSRPRCFQRAMVCDYTDIPSPRHARPWAAVQAVAAYHAGQLANHAEQGDAARPGAAGRSRGFRSRTDAPAPMPAPAAATTATATATATAAAAAAATTTAAMAAAAASAAPFLAPPGVLRVVLANRTSANGRGHAARPKWPLGVYEPPFQGYASPSLWGAPQLRCPYTPRLPLPAAPPPRTDPQGARL